MTVRDAVEHGHETPLLAAVDEINLRQKTQFVERISALTDGLDGRRVALLGLTFKPHTDDLRAAPALDIARMLIDSGATVVAYDPMETARRNAKAQVRGLIVVSTALEAIAGADVIALATEWPEFITLPWARMARVVRQRLVVDGRNALDPDALVEAGFVYSSFGRGLRVPGGATQPVAPRIGAQPVGVPVRAELAVSDL
jgi:UDPglucose 6-dehydrogenase